MRTWVWRVVRQVLGAMLVCGAGWGAAQAVISKGFTFQGQLQQSGMLQNGTCDFEFRLFNAASGGSQIGSTQTVSGVSVQDGLFTVLLNGGGEFGAGAFIGTERWLDIAVRCPAGAGSFSAPFSPRQALTAAPYALYAVRCDTSEDVSCTECISSVNLLPDSVTSAKIADGNITAADLGPNSVTSAKIADGTIATADLGANSITSANIADGTIAAADLAADSVTSAKIADGSIGAAELANATVTAAKIAPGANGQVLTTSGGAAAWAAPSVGPATVWSLTGNSATNPSTNFLGTTDNQPVVLRANNQRVLALYGGPSGGSPQIIAGHSTNAAPPGAQGATISGGGGNIFPSAPNVVDDSFGTVGGGAENEAGSNDGDVSSSGYATVAGGFSNSASGPYSAIVGGYDNRADGDSSHIGGGRYNLSSGVSSTVGGGNNNSADDLYSTVGGGEQNAASGDRSTVGGGSASTASGSYSVVSGGRNNQAMGDYAAVLGGGGTPSAWGNKALGPWSIVGGGNQNSAPGDTASILGGTNNSASGPGSMIGGGSSNATGASALYAAVPGGAFNVANGEYSFAAGRRAKANANGCFAWSDSGDADFTCPTANRFMARASGGVVFYTNSSITTGVVVAPGGGSWASVSDRNVKRNVTPVDGRAVLEKVATTPVHNWSYESQDPSIRHIGPMAQDFHAAFGVGEDDTHITTVDADGVAFAAIQGLYQVVQEKEREIASQRRQIAVLEARLTALENRLPAAQR